MIGAGSAETGDFQYIGWAVGNKWLRVEMDPDGGNSFQLMGSQQFMSVPYAFYSRYAGSNPLTAGEGIAINNNVISNVGDADANSQNELNTNLSFGADHILRLTDAGGTKQVDLSPLISPGSMPQDLQLDGDKLKITDNAGATEIDLAPYRDNTDAQQLSISGNELAISGGNTVDLTPYLDNTDSQSLSLTGTSLSISGGTGVNLSPFKQDLSSTASGTNRTIGITNGLPTTIDVADNDNSTTNEIQDLTRSGNILSLSSDVTPVDLSPYLDDTDEQRLTLSGSSLSIDRGNTVSLAGFMDDTDDQDLSLNPATHSLSLTGDLTPVNLSPYLDNTDNQNLSIMSPGNTRTISIDNGTGVSFSVADGDADATNELQSLSYNSGTKVLSISTGNNVTISETQNLNQVLLQGNDANGQRVTNLGSPAADGDAVTKKYVDDADDAINSRISANYAFKTGFTFSALLAVSEVTLPLAGESFDDFDVIGTSSFTAQTAGTYLFVLDGTASGVPVPGVNLLYNGTKYPVAISGGRYNSTFMFRLTAGETVSVVGTGLVIGAGITGQFYGYKLL